MTTETLAPLLASAQASHAALVARAKSLSGAAADEAWSDAGVAHRIAANLCVLLATASLERGTNETA